MNFQGQRCKECLEVITAYSTSGYCRKCWHKRRGGKAFPGSKLKTEDVNGKKVG